MNESGIYLFNFVVIMKKLINSDIIFETVDLRSLIKVKVDCYEKRDLLLLSISSCFYYKCM